MNDQCAASRELGPVACFAYAPDVPDFAESRDEQTLRTLCDLQPATRVTEAPGNHGDTIAIVKGTDFKDGTLEVELAGQPAVGAPEGSRGFVGLAFRKSGFYLRPTNGRADDQLRRNHSTQYVSEPEFPWQRLRKESPGVYESYVDLVPGEWTKVKIVVEGVSARLYVHDAPEPVLIVNDPKACTR